MRLIGVLKRTSPYHSPSRGNMEASFESNMILALRIYDLDNLIRKEALSFFGGEATENSPSPLFPVLNPVYAARKGGI